MERSERLKYSRELFKRVAPTGWNLYDGSSVGQGGHSGVCTVVHADARQGVFRCLLPDATQTLVRRFHRELELLTTEINHPNVMRLLECSNDPAQHWYISKRGEPLDRYWEQQRSALSDRPNMLVEEAICIIDGVASGLAECHAHGIVHRDIKPKNIVMMRDVPEIHPVIIDFGIAFDGDAERLTPSDEATGNARYSPSEMRWRSDEYPPWVDVSALAQTMLWLLEVKPPKHYWPRPVEWQSVEFDARLPEHVREKLQALAAACSMQATAPSSGEQVRALIRRLFDTPETRVGAVVDNTTIRTDMQVGHARALRAEVENRRRYEACFPQAKLTYVSLREHVGRIMETFPEGAPVKIKADLEFTKESVLARMTDRRSGRWDAGSMYELAIGRVLIWRFGIYCLLIFPEKPVWEGHRLRDFRRDLPESSSPFTFLVDCTPRVGRVRPPTWITINPDGSLTRHTEGPNRRKERVVESLDEVKSAMTRILSNSDMWQDAGL